jgi:hypothetical protein
VRLFDVDYDENTKHTIPVAPLRIETTDQPFTYVPVVFITQKAIVLLSDSGIGQMAQNICTLADNICVQAGMHPAELQLDCDWTSTSSKKYFALLKAIKEQKFMQGKALSCTIRLNQIKYQSLNGIPPADKGLVMIYGMGDLKKPGSHNSILDPGEAKAYLKYLSGYPLSVDVALPLFEWCVLFRENQFKGIIHEVATSYVKTSQLFKQKEGNTYICTADTSWQGYQFKANDIIRLESPSFDDIQAIARYSSARVKGKDLNVILFSCDSITLSKFSNNEMEAVYNSYN